MLHDDALECLMTLYVTWYCLKTPDDAWWRLITLDDAWGWIRTLMDALGQCLMLLDDCLVTQINNTWWHLMMFYYAWRDECYDRLTNKITDTANFRVTLRLKIYKPEWNMNYLSSWSSTSLDPNLQISRCDVQVNVNMVGHTWALINQQQQPSYFIWIIVEQTTLFLTLISIWH